ncbi:MAG: hypothetical protein AB1899_00095 [Pseudomonadota bacterium]
MTAPPSREPQDLRDAARAAMAALPRRRVVFARWQGRDYVVKRHAAKPRAAVKLALLRGLCRLLFPGHVLAGTLAPVDGLMEARRIRALAAAGVLVPDIALELPDAMVYGRCGLDLDHVLRPLDQPARRRLMALALADLARFHGAGHWHGGTQFRNQIVVEGADGPRFCRIDFEEDLDGLLTLPLLQVYDLLLFLTDVLDFAGPSAEGRDFARSLLEQYRTTNGSPVQAQLLARLALLARPVTWLAPLLDRFGNNDSRRVLALARLILDRR